MVRDQDASDLRIGEEGLAHWQNSDRDLEKRISAGVDIRERKLPRSELAAGVRVVLRTYLPELFDHLAQIWHK